MRRLLVEASCLVGAMTIVVMNGCQGKSSSHESAKALVPDHPSAIPTVQLAPAASEAHSVVAASSNPESRAGKRPVDKRAYDLAMNQARVATRAGQYQDAYAAFERALEAWPHDPRAIAERGYAHLLEEELDKAATDLWRASRLDPNDALGAQIWFNLGVLAEKQGDDAAAKSAFARSLMLRPSGLAKKKLAARPLCGAVIARNRPSDDSQRVIRAKNWLDAYQQLYGNGRDPKGDPPPRNNAEARKSLCTRRDVDRCDEEGPWVLSRYLNSAFGELEDHVFQEPDQSLLIFHTQVARMTDVTGLNHFTCISTEDFAVNRLEGLLRVTNTANHQDWSGDKPNADTCPTPRSEIEDSFYDTATTKELLRVTRPGGSGAAEVELDGNRVTISAGTCRASIALREKS